MSVFTGRIRRRQSTPGYVYLFRDTVNGLYKIGLSKRPINRREKLQNANVLLIHTIPTADMRRLESALHARYAPQRVKGEWFALLDEHVKEITGWKECPWGKVVGRNGESLAQPYSSCYFLAPLPPPALTLMALLRASPFRPFRLFLKGGEVFTVSHPSLVLVSPDEAILALPYCEDPRFFTDALVTPLAAIEGVALSS